MKNWQQKNFQHDPEKGFLLEAFSSHFGLTQSHEKRNSFLFYLRKGNEGVLFIGFKYTSFFNSNIWKTLYRKPSGNAYITFIWPSGRQVNFNLRWIWVAYPIQIRYIYLLKINNKNTRKGSKICLKLTIKTL